MKYPAMERYLPELHFPTKLFPQGFHSRVDFPKLS